MLKVDKKTLDHMEQGYPGILKNIMDFETAILPSCPHCRSDNTADVQIGIIGRTINIVAATTKVKLLANGPKPGKYYCHGCQGYFNDVPDMENMEVIKMEKKFRDEFKEMGIEVATLTKEEEESLEVITYSVPKSVKSSKSPQTKDNTAMRTTGQKTARGSKKLMKRLNILVVEDGRSQREMLRDFLLSEGHKVMEAENGEKAIEAVLNGHPDLVLVDYKMPGMDGLEVLKETKRINPGIDVVIVTAYGTIETAVEAMKAGATDYVTKPLELDELLALIDSVAERRQLLKTNMGKRIKISQLLTAWARFQKENKEDITRMIHRFGKEQENSSRQSPEDETARARGKFLKDVRKLGFPVNIQGPQALAMRREEPLDNLSQDMATNASSGVGKGKQEGPK